MILWSASMTLTRENGWRYDTGFPVKMMHHERMITRHQVQMWMTQRKCLLHIRKLCPIGWLHNRRSNQRRNCVDGRKSK